MTVLRKLAGVVAAAAGVAAVRHFKRPIFEPEPPPELTPEDHAHVKAWLAEEVQRLRTVSYEELLQYEGQEFQCERLTPSGAYVMRETRVFCDDPSAGTLRVVVVVEGEQLRSTFMPPSIAQDEIFRDPDDSLTDD